MSNTNGWDKTLAASGEFCGKTDDELMAELYQDPDFQEYMEQRRLEAMEYQATHDPGE